MAIEPIALRREVHSLAVEECTIVGPTAPFARRIAPLVAADPRVMRGGRGRESHKKRQDQQGHVEQNAGE